MNTFWGVTLEVRGEKVKKIDVNSAHFRGRGARIVLQDLASYFLFCKGAHECRQELGPRGSKPGSGNSCRGPS